MCGFAHIQRGSQVNPFLLYLAQVRRECLAEAQLVSAVTCKTVGPFVPNECLTTV
jgi:hypothetical protein